MLRLDPKFIIFALCLFAAVFGKNVMAEAELVHPDDLIYKGAFRLPNEYSNNSHWEYGGLTLALYPYGDLEGQSDGYPGSLYSVGQITNGPTKLVSEFSIPVPVNSTNLGDLNTAVTLQPFDDLTGGFFDQVLSGQLLNEVRGLTYLEAQQGQSSGKMYWSIWSAYNVADVNLPSQGYSDVTISSPNAQGVWKLNGYHSKIVSGYLFDIPRDWADAYIGSKYLATGISREGGAFGRGPALFAIATYDYTNTNPPINDELPTTPLIYYNSTHSNYPAYERADEWRGGSWITYGNKEAVIFVGRKCIGPTYYGDAGIDACSGGHGYHCYPREPQMVFYDPDDLKEVASGSKNPWDVVPYNKIDLRNIIPHYSECSQTQGATYDRDNNLLYIIQSRGDGTKPLVHVFSVRLTGDLNSDGKVDITDVQACVNHVLGAQDYGTKADVNSDGAVNIIDVQSIVNTVLGS